MIRIDVTGDRAEGKTVTALRVVLMLRSMGFEVEYRNRTAEGTDTCEELIADGHFEAGTEPRRFLVTDLT